MEKKSSAVLSPLPNQPTWLVVEGTNWILCKEPFLGKEGVYNMRNATTHRPAEYFEMMEEIKKLSIEIPGTLEEKVWLDLAARCSYIAYNAVKQLHIRDAEIESKSNVIYNLRNKLLVADRQIKGWRALAYASIIVDMIIALYLLMYF